MPVDLGGHHSDLRYLSPLSDQRAQRLVAFLIGGEPKLILELGCGWAGLLLQALDALPTCHGVGIDIDAEAVEQGRKRCAQLGLVDRLSLIVGDASAVAPPTADAVICIGASQIWDPTFGTGPITEPLDYHRALRAIRGLVPRGGRVVYGEAIWSATPTPEATAPLSGRSDEYVSLPELVDIAASLGFAPLAFHEADRDEWDTFESGISARYSRWLSEHTPSDPDYVNVKRDANKQRAGYLHGYRDILGMAYLELLAI